ncbi:MAG TPA: SDR family NAD(P)-dependent oxidoreductase [Steroidobacteraceae bacterium]|nr:SDR family NAD(P)-dependent oxidoreductase [Steroidobacteraceae bacterium]
MDFSGRHVVITGASSGIGYATAAKIVSLGGCVTLMARRAELLERAQRALGEAASCLAVDVADKLRLLAALDGAVERRGPIDALFLNAAFVGDFVPIWEYPDHTFEEVLRVNVSSPFWTVRHVLPAMMARRKGAILITGSLSSETGMAGNSGYVVSKHAALGLARSVAVEAAGSGVRCNCMLPGFIDTAMLAAVPDEKRAAMAGRTPLQRIGDPAEAAEVAAFLLSDAASHVTAQSWAVDGGLLGTLML